MSHECVDPRLLGEILELEANDPRRLEIEHCPRCRVLLQEYARFLEGPRERDETLLKFLEQTPRRAVRPRRRWQAPLMAAAAVLILAVGLSRWDFFQGPGRSVERGEDGAGGFAATATVDADSVLFQWEPIEGADGYTVAIFNEDLSERLQLPVGAEALRLRVAAAEVAEPGETVAWRVLALADSDEIDRSVLGFLTLP